MTDEGVTYDSAVTCSDDVVMMLAYLSHYHDKMTWLQHEDLLNSNDVASTGRSTIN